MSHGSGLCRADSHESINLPCVLSFGSVSNIRRCCVRNIDLTQTQSDRTLARIRTRDSLRAQIATRTITIDTTKFSFTFEFRTHKAPRANNLIGRRQKRSITARVKVRQRMRHLCRLRHQSIGTQIHKHNRARSMIPHTGCGLGCNSGKSG